MDLKNLKNPFIVYWDICSPAYNGELISRACDDLIKSNIFIVCLRNDADQMNPAVPGVIDRLNKKNIKVKLNVSSRALDYTVLKKFKKGRLLSLYIEMESMNQIQSVLDAVVHSSNEGYSTGIAFNLDKTNFSEMPDIISFCTKNNIRELEFPIQRADGGDIFFPDTESVRRLAGELKTTTLLRQLKITIHDPFLWKLFFTKEHPEGMGCNGANTMVYISRNFDITPCPLLSVKIGNLYSESLKAIFLSEKRKQIRKEILSPPQECHKCSAVNYCKGGCRGRTYALFGTLDKKDPVCKLSNTLCENTL